MSNIQEVASIIKQAKDIVIASHVNPDDDSIGSLLSLGLGLKSQGKKIYMISADGIPQKYSFLPGAKLIRKNLNKKTDLAISVDCSNKEILGNSYEVFKRSKLILEIDHHEFRRPFGQLAIIDHKAAAVGEIIYNLLKFLNIKITKNIATSLLTSIIVETNSFRLPNVRQFTFKVCAELFDKGVNFYNLVKRVFWSRTHKEVVLSGICLSRARFLKKNKLIWSIIKQTDLNKLKAKDEDVDAVADEMRSIEGTKIVVLFRQKNHKQIRVSLRSKDKINVAGIAEYYNGGGHFDVAGCLIPNTQKAITDILKMAARLIPP